MFNLNPTKDLPNQRRTVVRGCTAEPEPNNSIFRCPQGPIANVTFVIYTFPPVDTQANGICASIAGCTNFEQTHDAYNHSREAFKTAPPLRGCSNYLSGSILELFTGRRSDSATRISDHQRRQSREELGTTSYVSIDSLCGWPCITAGQVVPWRLLGKHTQPDGANRTLEIPLFSQDFAGWLAHLRALLLGEFGICLTLLGRYG